MHRKKNPSVICKQIKTTEKTKEVEKRYEKKKNPQNIKLLGRH